MQIKKNLLQYKRDTYLNNTNEKFKYKKNLSIIKCDTNMKSLWNSISRKASKNRINWYLNIWLVITSNNH